MLNYSNSIYTMSYNTHSRILTINKCNLYLFADEESRRVYRLPAPPAYSPRDYPLHPPPAYETHLPLPGAAD